MMAKLSFEPTWRLKLADTILVIAQYAVWPLLQRVQPQVELYGRRAA